MLENWKITDTHTDLDQSQNPTDWFLAESLSFHKIWFKSVNNFSRCRDRQADRQTDAGYHSSCATLLAEVTRCTTLRRYKRTSARHAGRLRIEKVKSTILFFIWVSEWVSAEFNVPLDTFILLITVLQQLKTKSKCRRRVGLQVTTDSTKMK